MLQRIFSFQGLNGQELGDLFSLLQWNVIN